MSRIIDQAELFLQRKNPFCEKVNTCTSTLFLNYGEQHLTMFKSLTKFSLMKRKRENSDTQSFILNRTLNSYFREHSLNEQQDTFFTKSHCNQSYFSKSNLSETIEKSIKNPFDKSSYENTFTKVNQNKINKQKSKNNYCVRKQKSNLNEREHIRHEFSKIKLRLKDKKPSQNEGNCANLSLIIQLYKHKKISQKTQQEAILTTQLQKSQQNSLKKIVFPQKYPPLCKRNKNKTQNNN